MREQLKSMGISYDWEKEISTCDPEYIKQQQKFLLNFLMQDYYIKKKPGRTGTLLKIQS